MANSALKTRLIEAREESGYSKPAVVARLAGITASALYQLEEGKTKSLKAETAQKLAAVYEKINIDWLISGTPPKYNSEKSNLSIRDMQSSYLKSVPETGYTRLRLMEGGKTAGKGAMEEDFPEVLRELDIAEWQVRQQIGYVPKDDRVKLLTARGNSNYPKIKNGDVVFVDTSQKSYEGDDFYLIKIHGFPMIKRLQMMGDGIHVNSTNPDYESEVIKITEGLGIGVLSRPLVIMGRIVGFAQFRRSEEI